MPKYSVEVEWITKEVATTYIEVEAESEAEACAKVESMAHKISDWRRSEIVEGEFVAVGADQI